MMSRPFIVGVGGFESNVGKTTLMCDLLREFPEWEAIKTTRGHYRSCGKDPHACCVSHLLADEPVVISGKSETYEEGKDTGRYWKAGATNVHWLIVTDNQLEKGINESLSRVKAPGVLIEGNSFTRYVRPDYFLMVKTRYSEKIKTTARQSLEFATALYISDLPGGPYSPTYQLTQRTLPSRIYSRVEFPTLVEDLRSRFHAQQF